jgi:hypothetical protein
VSIKVGSDGNPNFIQVTHGRMLINVPRRIFKDGTALVREEEAREFRHALAKRFPWLSRYAIDEIMKKAVETMASLLDMEKGDVQRAKEMLILARADRALELADQRLSKTPDYPDAWYVKGEALLRLGRAEDGFRAMAHARNLSGQARKKRRVP